MKTGASHWGAGFSPRGDLSPLAEVQAATLLSTGCAGFSTVRRVPRTRSSRTRINPVPPTNKKTSGIGL